MPRPEAHRTASALRARSARPTPHSSSRRRFGVRGRRRVRADEVQNSKRSESGDNALARVHPCIDDAARPPSSSRRDPPPALEAERAIRRSETLFRAGLRSREGAHGCATEAVGDRTGSIPTRWHRRSSARGAAALSARLGELGTPPRSTDEKYALKG